MHSHDESTALRQCSAQSEKAVTPNGHVADLRGYQTMLITHEGQRMVQITTLTGRQIRMEHGDRLLVVNDVPEYVVKTLEDVIAAIRLYAAEHDLRKFFVNDVVRACRFAIEGDALVGDDHIMFLAIVPA